MADAALDVLAQVLVALDPFAAGGGELHQHRVVTFDASFGEQLAKGFEPYVDALGVVQAVHAEQDLAGVADLRADLLGPPADVAVAGFLVELGRVDGDRESADSNRTAVDVYFTGARSHTDRSAGGARPDQTPRQNQEVLRTAGQMESHQVRAEQAFDDLGPPGHLHEQLDRRERDVQKKTDRQIGPEFAQHFGDQLQLIVLHPDGRA